MLQERQLSTGLTAVDCNQEQEINSKPTLAHDVLFKSQSRPNECHHSSPKLHASTRFGQRKDDVISRKESNIHYERPTSLLPDQLQRHRRRH